MKKAINEQSKNEVDELLNLYVVSPLKEEIIEKLNSLKNEIEKLVSNEEINNYFVGVNGNITKFRNDLNRSVRFEENEDVFEELNESIEQIEDSIKALENSIEALENDLNKSLHFEKEEDVFEELNGSIEQIYQEIEKDIEELEKKLDISFHFENEKDAFVTIKSAISQNERTIGCKLDGIKNAVEEEAKIKSSVLIAKIDGLERKLDGDLEKETNTIVGEINGIKSAVEEEIKQISPVLIDKIGGSGEKLEKSLEKETCKIVGGIDGIKKVVGREMKRISPAVNYKIIELEQKLDRSFHFEDKLDVFETIKGTISEGQTQINQKFDSQSVQLYDINISLKQLKSDFEDGKKAIADSITDSKNKFESIYGKYNQLYNVLNGLHNELKPPTVEIRNELKSQKNSLDSLSEQIETTANSFFEAVDAQCKNINELNREAVLSIQMICSQQIELLEQKYHILFNISIIIGVVNTIGIIIMIILLLK